MEHPEEGAAFFEPITMESELGMVPPRTMGLQPGMLRNGFVPVRGLGISNPASDNCVAKGGTLSTVDTPQGQQGMCTLPNGTTCDEWAFMRGECGATFGWKPWAAGAVGLVAGFILWRKR